MMWRGHFVEQCQVLLFFQSLTGSDTTSYMYGVGKRKAYKALKCVQHNDMDLYGESQNITVLSESCLDQARQLIVKAYSGRVEDLTTLRTGKFLAGNGMLKSLPST